jgi:hypothetical protein
MSPQSFLILPALMSAWVLTIFLTSIFEYAEGLLFEIVIVSLYCQPGRQLQLWALILKPLITTKMNASKKNNGLFFMVPDSNSKTYNYAL